jgi:RNase II-type exonuclease
VLEDRVGQTFPAIVVDLSSNSGRSAVVQLQDPAVLARADGEAELGNDVTVRLVEAQIASGTVRFEMVP